MWGFSYNVLPNLEHRSNYSYSGKKCMVLCSFHFHHVEIWSGIRRYLLTAYCVADMGHTTVNKLTLPHDIWDLVDTADIHRLTYPGIIRMS